MNFVATTATEILVLFVRTSKFDSDFDMLHPARSPEAFGLQFRPNFFLLALQSLLSIIVQRQAEIRSLYCMVVHQWTPFQPIEKAHRGFFGFKARRSRDVSWPAMILFWPMIKFIVMTSTLCENPLTGFVAICITDTL